MRRPILGGLGAGLLVASSLPPWGWWPLGIAGAGLLVALMEGRPARQRAAGAAAFGLAMFGVGLFWLNEFSAPGYVLVTLLETAAVVVALVLVNPRRPWAVPAALVVAEALRGHWPFGGLPLGGIALGQAGGPLAPTARIGGQLLVVGLVGVGGVALAAILARRRTVIAVVALGIVAAAVVGGALAPGGRDVGRLRAALVQGGGRRGFRAVEGHPRDAFAPQMRASGRVRPPVGLVLWPEDVIDVDRLAGSPEDEAVAALARSLGATVVAGAVEDAGTAHFRNAAVAWAPSGNVVARYDKVHRVPFGEYIPGRRFIGRFADLSAVPRDLVAGRGPGVLDTPAGKLGALISYEVFYSDRARDAVRHGARVLLVPTNASSYRTSQVPGQELATARLRAIETGRAVLQAAPTGFTAVVGPHGAVRARSRLGDPAVLEANVGLRTGLTPAVLLGEWPLVALAAAVLGASWVGGSGLSRRIASTLGTRATPAQPRESGEVPIE